MNKQELKKACKARNITLKMFCDIYELNFSSVKASKELSKKTLIAALLFVNNKMYKVVREV